MRPRRFLTHGDIPRESASLENRMLARFARPRLFLPALWALVLTAALLGTLAWAAAQPATTPLAALEPLRLEIEQIAATLNRDGLGDEGLGELRDRVTTARDEIRGQIDALEPQLNDVDGRLKQLGPAPQPGAPPEDASLAAERERLNKSRTELDTVLRQARLAFTNADKLADRITERRRSQFTQRLFKRSTSALQLAFWRDVADAAQREARSIGYLIESWTGYARATGGASGIILAAATLVAFAAAATMFVRWWRRRAFVPRTDTRFNKALAAVIATFQVGLTAPLCVAAVLLVFDACGLIPPRIWEIGRGLIVAVAFASFGHGVAAGLLAPGEAARRLIAIDDTAARQLTQRFAWAARVLGATIILNTIHRAVVAPVSLTIATSALFALVTAILVADTLFRVKEAGEDGTSAASPRAQWIRALAWLVVAAILVDLGLGYIGFAAFLAGRLLLVLGVLAALYVALVLTDALFTEVVTGDTPRGRAIAATFGIGPRGIELIGTVLSAVLRVVLVLVAIFLILGRSGLFAADVFGAVQGAMFGFRIGDITISLSAILGALLALLIGIVATRGVQRWLQTHFLPRTGLEPSLQLSVSTIVGYLGVIAALTFTLAVLGIDVQKIALIAGALSVGIGFGLQSIVSNFVSGLILLAERPIRVGDSIIVKGEEGQVRKISVRATEIETYDRASVIIPNSELITGMVKNWTHADTLRRILIKVGVAYDSDPAQVRDILLACATGHALVRQTPAPAVLLAALGADALEFELYCVVTNLSNAGSVKSDLHFEILRRFREAGIVIPFPQREVRLVGEPAKAPPTVPDAG
jgi:potassium-dependent mechanosensitive channel